MSYRVKPNKQRISSCMAFVAAAFLLTTLRSRVVTTWHREIGPIRQLFLHRQETRHTSDSSVSRMGRITEPLWPVRVWLAMALRQTSGRALTMAAVGRK